MRSVLTFTSKFAYNCGTALQVIVLAEVYDVDKRKKYESNRFTFTFMVGKGANEKDGYLRVDLANQGAECQRVAG